MRRIRTVNTNICACTSASKHSEGNYFLNDWFLLTLGSLCWMAKWKHFSIKCNHLTSFTAVGNAVDPVVFFPQRWLQTRFPINLFPPIFCFPLYIYVAKAACESISGKFQTEKGKSTKEHIKNYSFVPEKTKLRFETCPGDDLVPGGRSERLWLLHVNSACSHSQGAGSFCQKNTLNSFKSFPSD